MQPEDLLVDDRQRPIRSLYISYDGLTDPLGEAQVLPYLIGLASRGHQISVLSAEKRERFTSERGRIAKICASAGIKWHPSRYRKSPPLFSTIADLIGLYRKASALQHQSKFDLVHCRSAISGLVGEQMQRWHSTPFLYDMRGFWADERIEGGIWNPRVPPFGAAYRFFKARERHWFNHADHVVSLTKAARELIVRELQSASAPPSVSVIPCCVDRDLFVPPTPAERVQVRADLSVPEHAQLFVYLGSIGTWYMLDEMLDCFAVARGRDPRSVLLFVTRDEPGPILAAAAARGVPEAALRIVPATRAEVPALAGSADAGLFFIRPTFSKLGSSPTKLGELLALGVPVLTNPGVGDVDRILGECGAGVTVSGFAPHAYAEALDRLSALRPDPARREQAVARWFDLDEGVRRYDSIYRQLAAKAAVGNARPAS